MFLQRVLGQSTALANSSFRRIGSAIGMWRWGRTMSISPRTDLVTLGTAYGRWTVPCGPLSLASTCYCVGVGEDISFDLGLIEHFGCVVHAFDPTPRSATFVKEQLPHEPRFVFHAYGLWSGNTVLKFYAPKNPEHVSHSAVNLQGTETYFEAPVKSLRTIMGDLGHTSLDLLKIDIEGAEYEVLEALFESEVRPNILCVEFDQPVPFSKPVAMVRRLAAAGYEPVNRDGWNVTFVLGRQPDRRS